MNNRVCFFVFILFITGIMDVNGDSIPSSVSNDSASRFATDTSAIPVHSFDKAKWNSLRKELVYKDNPDKPDSFQSKSSSSKSAFNLKSSIASDILFISIAAIVIIVLAILLRRNLLAKKKNKVTEEITIEEATADTDELILQSLLEKSMEEKNYREAIRAYYLLILHRLNKEGWIRWKKNKTNRQYIAELRSRSSFDLFREITRIYEITWYGNNFIEENKFRQYQPEFTDFLAMINSPGNE